jgi:hypothetical protein
MTAARCDGWVPGNRPCNAVLTERIDQIGRVRWHCQRCAARAAGRCWQCGKRRENPSPKAAYCAACLKAREAIHKRVGTMTPEQAAKRRASDARRRQKPEYRAQNTAHKRAWIAAHPEKKREYAEVARRKFHEKRADPVWWERQKAMQRARYAKRQAAAAVS